MKVKFKITSNYLGLTIFLPQVKGILGPLYYNVTFFYVGNHLLYFTTMSTPHWASLTGSVGKERQEITSDAEDSQQYRRSGLGRSPGEGHGNPLHYPFFKFYFACNWSMITFSIVMVSAIHQHQSAIGIHMSLPS